MALVLLQSALATPIFPKETLFFDRLAANDLQTKIIENPEIKITSIGVQTNKDVTRARIIVQAMPDCPENAPYQTNVLQCFYISMQNFDDNDVSKGEISFNVPKEWMTANSYDKNKLELRRYSYSWNDNGKLSTWKPTEISLQSENENNYNYKAVSDGFSYFSIVGNEKTNEITADVVKEELVTEQPTEEITPVEEKPAVIETSEQPDVTKTKTWFYILGLAVLSVVVSLTPAIIMPKEPKTPFEQLTSYIKNTKASGEIIRNNLKEAGWQDWQIDLGFKEVKRK